MEKKDPLTKRREGRADRLLPPDSRRGVMFVQGEGPTPARRVIIGEAPGRTEIEEGRPFVGRAGQILRDGLASISLNTDDIYITNIVKELPLDENGKIRRPNQEEIDVWYPQHVEEMILVTPKDPPFAKLLVGRTATDVLGGRPGAKLGVRLDEFTWTCTHPAAFLHRGSPDDEIREWVKNELLPWAEAVDD